MYATHMPKYMWEIERVETLEEEELPSIYNVSINMNWVGVFRKGAFC